MKTKNIIASKKQLLLYITITVITIIPTSCKKYLDAKPDKKLATPSSIQDLQGILDYYAYMNNRCTDAGEISSDDYYLSDRDFLAMPADRERAAYLWEPGGFSGYNPTDWQNEYTVVYNANVVLDNIGNITRTATNAAVWDNCKGSALMFRGKSFYEIAQVWTKAYDSATANTDLGIPLRLTSDFNAKSVRASLADTYRQIISDLKGAIPLLPNLPVFPFRPSKCAAYGELARTYLAMRDYQRAGLYADSCLQINDHLLDYNQLNPTLTYPFSAIQFSNPEDIMYTVCVGVNYSILPWIARVDSSLYQSYDSNDLRKGVFFVKKPDGTILYHGSYGTWQTYNGIATDEMYLIRAECEARQGSIVTAMNDLNTLLSKRWKEGTFTPFTANNKTDALNLILTERRKELIFRTLRFTDIKRLNKEGANIVQQRIIQGKSYILAPNDPRYALPIPDNVIEATGMPQNPRN